MATSAESSIIDDDQAFNYDYDTLRTTGVILAVVMFVSGILIALTPVQLKDLRYQSLKCRHRQYEGPHVQGRGPFQDMSKTEDKFTFTRMPKGTTGESWSLRTSNETRLFSFF
uniref:FXYD domain-containing ion transport regulator n=1 Tax=Chanos chanos TaxID=29144 RepID=A0A6S4IR53_CHACN|nr:FXYD7a [Chanos chanos]